jgi:hypothetical protein
MLMMKKNESSTLLSFFLCIPQNEIQKVVQAHCIASDKQTQKPIYLHTHNYQQHIIPDWPQIAEQD